MIPICQIALSKESLKTLCDSAEKREYPTGPVKEYWAKASPTITASVWLHHCMELEDEEPPYTRNQGRCIRLIWRDGESGMIRADIDLEDWTNFFKCEIGAMAA
jgi:hypothetical protein